MYVAHCICDVVHHAVAMELRANNVDFADDGFLSSLLEYINKLSMIRFLIEQAIISWIAKNGLDVEPLNNQQMTMTVIRNRHPDWQKDITKNPVLYYPRAFNF